MILETSWEVCNKMGGIYTVLSSRADVMTQHHPAQVCFIGPLLADEGAALPLDFTPGEIPELQGWLREVLPSLGLRVVAGRWGIEGEPPVLLVDFKPLWREKDDLYFELWKAYGLESDKGYGDYDESSLFSIAAARLMASIAAWRSDERTIAIFNEWQTAMGLLYLRQQAPSVRTLFITHATTVGRSIAGNDKELYTYMDAYDADKARFSVFKVARISELTLSDTFSKRHFTPLPYDGGTWMNENKVPVILHVQKIVLDRFVELLGYNAIKPINSDIYEITYPLNDNDWGYNTLLAFGKYITVISPKHFLKHFTSYIDTIHKQYPN